MTFCLLQEAGLVNDQNRRLLGKRFQCVLAHNLAQRVGVPPAAAQDRLLTPGTEITHRLRAHPARLSRFVAKKSVQKLPSRYGNPLLTEQGTYPRFHIPQRRRPSSSVVSTDAPAIHDLPNHGGPSIQKFEQNATVMLGAS